MGQIVHIRCNSYDAYDELGMQLKVESIGQLRRLINFDRQVILI